MLVLILLSVLQKKVPRHTRARTSHQTETARRSKASRFRFRFRFRL